MKKIRAVLFDLNGTLIDIWTADEDPEPYRILADALGYCNLRIDGDVLRQMYWAWNKEQRHKSREHFPEFDVVQVFMTILRQLATEQRRDFPEEWLMGVARWMAAVFRAAALRRLILYPEVYETLQWLRERYMLAAVSDGQSLWAWAELRKLELEPFFHTIIISGDYGYRKPDRRLYEAALSRMQIPAEEAVFVGNDGYRDIYGASESGMGTVFFHSNQGDLRDRRREPDYIIYHFGELPEALQFLENR